MLRLSLSPNFESEVKSYPDSDPAIRLLSTTESVSASLTYPNSESVSGLVFELDSEFRGRL